MIDRPGLAEFLRRRRARLTPSDIGLPDTSRRRTPGLRREEVAVLAGISSDFYARLEQARGSDPSESVVAALARALRCTPDEKDHLFRLAGVPIPPRQVGHHLDPGLLQLAAHLDDLPTLVHNDLGDILHTNALDDALFCRRELRPGRDSNVYWHWFTNQESRDCVPEADWARLSAAATFAPPTPASPKTTRSPRSSMTSPPTARSSGRYGTGTTSPSGTPTSKTSNTPHSD